MALIACLFIASVIALAPATVSAQLTLYDDFNGQAVIDASKWRGGEDVVDPSQPAPAVFNSDIRREIVTDQLRLLLTSHGPEGSSEFDNGTGISRNRLVLAHKGFIDGAPKIGLIEAAVTVAAAEAVPCVSHAELMEARAGVQGAFFRTSALGNPERDMHAGIYLVQRSNGDEQIVAFTHDFLTGDRVARIFDETWTIGTPVVLTIRYQPTLNRFRFTARNGTNAAEEKFITYTANDAPRRLCFAKQVQVENVVHVCFGTSVMATMDARFDNVRISKGAVESMVE
ncbi:MAG: hypothetical protein WED01_16125 [Candidatus Rokuibacteriota bacterium]